MPDSLFSTISHSLSLVYLLAWHLPLHTLYISSPNHCLLLLVTEYATSYSSTHSLLLWVLLSTSKHFLHLLQSIAASLFSCQVWQYRQHLHTWQLNKEAAVDCSKCIVHQPSVLWCCWFGSRKGTWPVKNEWWGASMVICLEWGADLHMVQLMPLPLTVSCSRKSRLVLVLPFWYWPTQVVPDKIQRAVKQL